MSPASHLYFDHAHEPDPEERGLYWATRYTNTRKAFGFMPEDLYDSFEIDDKGEPSGDYCSIFGGCVKPQKLENIIGECSFIFLHVDDSVEDIITLQNFFSSSVGCSPTTPFPRFSTKLAFTETIFDTFLLKSSHL